MYHVIFFLIHVTFKSLRFGYLPTMGTRPGSQYNCSMVESSLNGRSSKDYPSLVHGPQLNCGKRSGLFSVRAMCIKQFPAPMVKFNLHWDFHPASDGSGSRSAQLYILTIFPKLSSTSATRTSTSLTLSRK